MWKKGVAAHACHTHCRLSGPCTPGRDIFLKFSPAHLSPGRLSEALWARFLGLAPALVCSGSTSVPDVPWVAQKLPVRPPHASRASPKAPGHPQDTPKDPQVAPNKQEPLPKTFVFYIFCCISPRKSYKGPKRFQNCPMTVSTAIRQPQDGSR